MAGARHGGVFAVDVSLADPRHGAAVEARGSDAFAFIGVPPVVVRAYPAGSHRAEGAGNGRVKDLADSAPSASTEELDAADQRPSIVTSCSFRDPHPVPADVPEPPASWSDRTRPMAVEESLPWKGLPHLVEAVRSVLDPVRAGRDGTWNPEGGRWVTPAGEQGRDRS